jgi:hypothetical protein
VADEAATTGAVALTVMFQSFDLGRKRWSYDVVRRDQPVTMEWTITIAERAISIITSVSWDSERSGHFPHWWAC